MCLFEELLGVAPNFEEVLVSPQQFSFRVRSDVCVHVRLAQPGGRGLRAVRGLFGGLSEVFLVCVYKRHRISEKRAEQLKVNVPHFKRISIFKESMLI